MTEVKETKRKTKPKPELKKPKTSIISASSNKCFHNFGTILKKDPVEMEIEW